MSHRSAVIVLCAVVLFSPRAGAGESLTNSVGMKMMRIEAGAFEMGSEGKEGFWWEKPKHTVRISRPFYMSETEVSVEQFKKFRPDFEGTPEYNPYAAGVNWYDAIAYCEWLSKKEGKSYRLPTEAE